MNTIADIDQLLINYFLDLSRIILILLFWVQIIIT